MSIHYTWADLDRELQRWQAQDLTATFWWRDDDACRDSEALARLIELSVAADVPLSLAVIPALLQLDLPAALRRQSRVTVLQHGWEHRSHSPPNQKKAEYGDSRPLPDMLQELDAGRALLQSAFSNQFVAVLVPPWNRYTPALLPELGDAGLAGISAMWARTDHTHSPLQVNTHIDPVAWRADRGFLGLSDTLEQIINHLRLRRECAAWLSEPTGLLTHHLDHTEEVWEFCQQLLQRLAEHSCVRWQSASGIWAAG